MAETKSILVEIDKGLWFRFRGSAFNQGKTVKDLLAEVIRGHLGETPENETSENEPENEPSEPKSNRPSRRDFDRDKSTLEEDEDPSVLSEAEAEARFRGNKR